MKLKIINSGSSGNCYLLQASNGSTLIIECGVRMTDIKKALDFDLKKVVGVLISHEHNDHCKAVKDVMSAGVNVYASAGTIEAMQISNYTHRIFRIERMNTYTIGDFKVMPFDVKHDAKEPFGFLINHTDCGNVLFITDTYYVPHTFKNLNNIIIEANYDKEIVAQRIADENIHGKVRDRVIESHMSIDTCLDLLKSNDLSKINNIVLIHLSDGNSNAADFKKRAEELTGKTVTVAEKGIEIDFDKTPF